MLHLTQQTQILLAIHPLDFRRGLDGFIAYCQHQLSANPRSGQLFVFMNRARTRIRVLCFDGNGYWLATKRLSRGRYGSWPSDGHDNAHVGLSILATEVKKIIHHAIASRRKNR